MTSNNTKPSEIIAIKEKYNTGFLKVDVLKTRNNSNSKYPTFYIPISIKGLDGKWKRVSIKMTKQILASSAKIPNSVTEEEARDVRVCYREINDDDLKNSDYPSEKWDDLKKENSDFIKALDIIADEYLNVVEEQIINKKHKQFRLGKNKTINSFRQTHRNPSDDEINNDDENIVDGQIKLPSSLFRIKIPANISTPEKKIGRIDKNGHSYIIYDARKCKKVGGKIKLTPAKIRSGNGTYQDLTCLNAKHFVTYMSLTAGVIDFDSICISKSGISLMNRFTEMLVWPHKIMKTETINEDDLSEMAGFGTNGYVDEEVELDNEEKESKKYNNVNSLSDDEEEFLDDPDENSEPEDNQEEEVPPPLEHEKNNNNSDDEKKLPVKKSKK